MKVHKMTNNFFAVLLLPPQDHDRDIFRAWMFDLPSVVDDLLAGELLLGSRPMTGPCPYTNSGADRRSTLSHSRSDLRLESEGQDLVVNLNTFVIKI